MDPFAEYLAGITNPQHRERMEQVFHWILDKFPSLEPRFAWNQPMYTDHDTYIIGFSASKAHMAVAPERAGIERFVDEIEKAGYDHTKELVRIKWTSPVDFSLLEQMIEFNMADKADCTTFWRD